MRYLYTKEKITFTTACVVNIFWLYVFKFLNYVECFLHVIVLHLVFKLKKIFTLLRKIFPIPLVSNILKFFFNV